MILQVYKMKMVGHLFQNYDTIYVRFFSHEYLQSFLLHDIRAFFCHVYLRSFLLCGVFYSQVYDHFLRNAHILQTSMWYMGSQKVVVKEAPTYTVSKTPFMYDG